jgi:hypothetical protein
MRERRTRVIMTASALSPVHLQEHPATPPSSSYPIHVYFTFISFETSVICGHYLM